MAKKIKYVKPPTDFVLDTNKYGKPVPPPPLPGGYSKPSPFAPPPTSKPITPPTTPPPKSISEQVSEIFGTLPKTEKTQGFNQEMLDEARRQGIDVFAPGNLKKISAIEQGAQANISLQEQALTSFLEGQPPTIEQKNLTPEERLQAAKETSLPQAIAESAFGVKIGEGNTVGKEIADIIDFIRVGITGKKPLDVQQAETALNDAMTQIGREIDYVKTGKRSARDAKTTFILANEALNRLEASQRDFGRLNVRYWSDEGKEIETEILITKQRLADMRLELLQAIAAGAII